MTAIEPQAILKLSESKLYDYFIAQCSGGAHLKGVNDYKYITCNKTTSQVFGLDDPNDMIGFTIHDLDRKFMRKFWGDDYADNIAKLDHQVKDSGEAVFSNNDILLNGLNQVRIQNLVKFPFKGKNNKVTAILSITNDLTKNTDLFYLWDLYKKMHKDMASAITNFAAYLKMDKDFFQVPVTEKEIISLLNLIKNQSHRGTKKS